MNQGQHQQCFSVLKNQDQIFFSLFPEEEVCEETGRVRRDDENQLLVPSADICNQLPVNGHEV